MNSGLEISDDIVKSYKQMAFKRNLRYVIFKLDEGKTKLEIEHEGERDKTFEDMKN